MNVLENIREEHSLTKADMAQRLEITEAYYSMLINGVRNISKPLALKIKGEFKLSLDDILLADVHRKTSTSKSEAV